MHLWNVTRVNLQVFPRLQTRQRLNLDIEFWALHSLCHLHPSDFAAPQTSTRYCRSTSRTPGGFLSFGCLIYEAVSKIRADPTITLSPPKALRLVNPG